jgi:type II secretory pathway component PulC
MEKKSPLESHAEAKSRAIPLREPEPFLVGAPSSLVVNGIALQDDPMESVAVVNGRILKKGMTIEGAEVDRIFLDRVRFRGDGGVFEVHLSK